MRLYKITDTEFVNVDTIKKISIKEDENERQITEAELAVYGEDFQHSNGGVYVFSAEVRAYLADYPEYEGFPIFRKIFECPAYIPEKQGILSNTPARDKIFANPEFNVNFSKYITLMQKCDERGYIEAVRKEAHDIIYPAAVAFLEDFMKKYQN